MPPTSQEVPAAKVEAKGSVEDSAVEVRASEVEAKVAELASLVVSLAIVPVIALRAEAVARVTAAARASSHAANGRQEIAALGTVAVFPTTNLSHASRSFPSAPEPTVGIEPAVGLKTIE